MAATIGLKLSDVTFLDNQLMYHNESNKISKEQNWTFSIWTLIQQATEQYRESEELF